MKDSKKTAVCREFRLATRSSPLAMIQAEFVKARLEQAGNVCRLNLVKTQGDKILDKALSEIGGKGLFIKELEFSLIKEESDFAVHSLKDLPCRLHEDFEFVAYLPRDYPHDVIVMGSGTNIFEKSGHDKESFLKKQDFAKLAPCKIATGSLRRQALLQNANKEIKVLPIRGNIGTRLGTLESSYCDALILSEASLERLDFDRAKFVFYKLDPTWFIPCTGQGIIAVEALKKTNLGHYLQGISCFKTKLCCELERKILACLGGSCLLPIGIYCTLEKNTYSFQVLVTDKSGEKQLYYKQVFSKEEKEELIVQKIKEDLYERGVNEILVTLGLPAIIK